MQHFVQFAKSLAYKHILLKNDSLHVCSPCSHSEETTLDNLIIPDPLPQILKENSLSLVEEQLIALVFVHQFVYLRGFGEAATKGHCINFSQSITNKVDRLPRLPADLPIVIVKKKNFDGSSYDIRVRRERILLWLEYLKRNSLYDY